MSDQVNSRLYIYERTTPQLTRKKEELLHDDELHDTVILWSFKLFSGSGSLVGPCFETGVLASAGNDAGMHATAALGVSGV